MKVLDGHSMSWTELTNSLKNWDTPEDVEFNTQLLNRYITGQAPMENMIMVYSFLLGTFLGKPSLRHTALGRLYDKVRVKIILGRVATEGKPKN